MHNVCKENKLFTCKECKQRQFTKKSTITMSASSKNDIEALLTLCGFPKVFFLLLKL